MIWSPTSWSVLRLVKLHARSVQATAKLAVGAEFEDPPPDPPPPQDAKTRTRGRENARSPMCMACLFRKESDGRQFARPSPPTGSRSGQAEPIILRRRAPVQALSGYRASAPATPGRRRPG